MHASIASLAHELRLGLAPLLAAIDRNDCELACRIDCAAYEARTRLVELNSFRGDGKQRAILEALRYAADVTSDLRLASSRGILAPESTREVEALLAKLRAVLLRRLGAWALYGRHSPRKSVRKIA